jgi:hypothetical protein
VEGSNRFSPFFVAINLSSLSARMYVDRRCVDNGKALMESGTMGLSSLYFAPRNVL